MKYIKLQEVCAVNMGQSPLSDSYNDKMDGLPFFQGNADFGEKYPITRHWCNKPVKIAKEGDILLSVRAPIGAVNYSKEICCIGRGLASLTPNKEKIISDFLFWYLRSKRNELEKKGTGSTFKAINKGIIENFLVPNINRDRQEKLVKNIGYLDSIISQRKQQLKLLDTLVNARFVEMFGDPLMDSWDYPKVRLGSLTEVGSSKRIFEKDYVSEGIPFYRTKEIVELSRDNPITTELFITRERYDEIRNKYGVPQRGDLLVSAVGTIGVIWAVDGKNEFYFKDGNLLRIAATDKFSPIYLKHLLGILISKYKHEMSSGTAYAALTISALKEMLVYEVSIVEQNQFANFVNQVDKSKLAVQKSLEEAQLLFDSLMQEYFG